MKFAAAVFSLLAAPLIWASNSVTLYNDTGSTETSQPFSISRVFAQGEFPSGEYPQPSVGGSGLSPYQVDVKSTWPDGSVKHAIVSFFQTISASGNVVVSFVQNSSASSGGSGLSLAGMIAFNSTVWGADIELTNGTTQTANIQTMINDSISASKACGTTGSNCVYWLNGPVVTAAIIEGATDTSAHATNYDLGWDSYKPLHPRFIAYFYAGWPGVKIDYIVENMWSTKLEDQSYSMVLKAGSPLSSVFTQSTFTHTAQSRWRETFWSGTVPGASHTDFNLPYMESTKILPNWDTSLTTTTAADVSAFTSSDKCAIGGYGTWYQQMYTTGGRPDIGLIPANYTRYLFNQNAAAYAAVIGDANCSGYVPIHVRELDATRYYDAARTINALGLPISLDARPTANFSEAESPDVPSWSGADAPTVVGTISVNGWYFTVSHSPAMAFVPYLLTGDYYFLEEIWYQSALEYTDAPTGWGPYQRGNAWGYSSYAIQTRGQAWAMRDHVQSQALSPSAAPEAAYELQKIDYTVNIEEGFHSVLHGNFPPTDATCAAYPAPWKNPGTVTTSQQNLWCYGHLTLMSNPDKGNLMHNTLHFPNFGNADSGCTSGQGDTDVILPPGAPFQCYNENDQWQYGFKWIVDGYAQDLGLPFSAYNAAQYSYFLHTALDPQLSPYLSGSYNAPVVLASTNDYYQRWGDLLQGWNTAYVCGSNTYNLTTAHFWWLNQSHCATGSGDDAPGYSSYARLQKATAAFAYQFGFVDKGFNGQAAYTWYLNHMCCNTQSTYDNDPSLEILPRLPAPSVISFTANGSPYAAVTSGTGVTLVWDTGGATTIQIDQSIGSVAASGSTTVNPTTTTIYTLLAESATGVQAAYVTVFVGTNTLSVTSSLSTTTGASGCSAVPVGQGCVINVTYSGASCGSYPGSNCTGLGGAENPWYQVPISITATGATSGLTYQINGFYCGGTAPICGNGNLWQAIIAPRNHVAETWNYTGYIGAGSNYATLSGSFTEVASTDVGPPVVYGVDAPFRFGYSNGSPTWPAMMNWTVQDGGNGNVRISRPQTFAATSFQEDWADATTAWSDYHDAGFDLVRQAQPPSVWNNYNTSTHTITYYPGGGGPGSSTTTGNGLVSMMAGAIAIRRAGMWYAVGVSGAPCSNSNSGLLPGTACDLTSNLDYTQTFFWLQKEFINRFAWANAAWSVNNENSQLSAPAATYYDSEQAFFRSQDPYQSMVIASYADVCPSGCTYTSGTGNLDVSTNDVYDSNPTTALPSNWAAAITPQTTYQPGQPNIWTEGGDRCTGAGTGLWDSDHPTNERFWIMTWTDLFQQAAPGWWALPNSGNGSTCTASRLSNMYVGSQEFAAMALYRSYASDFDPAVSKIATSVTGTCGGKTLYTYALGDTRDVGMFVANGTDRNSCASATIQLTMPIGMTGDWYNGQTGAHISTATISSGTQTLTVPTFTNFVVLRLRSTAVGPLIRTAMLPGIGINASYSQTLAAVGGTNPYTYTISSGNFPPGVTMTSGGVISGTPTVAGMWIVKIQATDSLGATSGIQEYRIPVFPALAFELSAYANKVNGVAPAQGEGLPIIGGVPPVSLAITSGSLPTSMATDGGVGALKNAPTVNGNYAATWTATDGASNTASASLNINVATGVAVWDQAFRGATVNTYYATPLDATQASGATGFGWTQTGLPGTLTLSSANNVITGTPTSTGNISLALTAANNLGSATSNFTIPVAAAPSFTTTTLPNAIVGTPYCAPISVANGTPPITLYVRSGALPSNFWLNQNAGYLCGMPLATGTTTFTLGAVDANQAVATQNLSLEASTSGPISLQTGFSPATGTLNSYPLGNLQWAMRFHNLPTSPPGSTIILAQFTTQGSSTISCEIPSGTLNVECFSSYGGVDGPTSLPLNGATDIRLVMTREQDPNYSQMRVDLWNGDCSGYEWSTMPESYGSEPATSSLGYQLGGSNIAVAFFRANNFPSGGINATITCPADAPTATAPNMDFRFEGDTLTDVSGNNYTLTASGSSFTDSPIYNPASIILTSSTAPRPVVPLAPFTLTSASITLNSAAGGNVPSSFAWTQTSGPSATIASPNSASTLVTPSADASYTFQLVVTDASSNTGTATLNVGVVNSDLNGIKFQTNSELGWIIGPISRFGTSPWPWFEQTEATDADVLAPYYAAAPAPATLFTGSGLNDAYFSGRGAFAGAITDSYDVEICSTGTPDSYCWRKNSGSWSSAIPIAVAGNCAGEPNSNAVTDGAIICFNVSTGHTLNDMWTRMAPLAGTASVSAASPNITDSSTGQICGGSPCYSHSITVVGSGTHWSTGNSAQKVCSGASYWLIGDFVGDGQSMGRFFLQIQSVTDDSHLVVNGNANYWPIPASLSGSMYLQQVGGGCGATQSVDFYNNFTGTSQPNTSLNYYESGLGLIRLAVATNLNTYTSEAQNWCTLWWDYGIGQGYNIVIPRNSGWHTLQACASMFGYTNWWGLPAPGWTGASTPGGGIAYNLTYENISPTSGVARDSIINGWDVRESAFATIAAAIMTHVYPAHTGSPSTTKAAWCGYTGNLANNLWLNPWTSSGGLYTPINSGQDAYWQDSLYGTGPNIAAPGAGNPPGNIAGEVMGTSPWRDSGLSNIGITELSRVMSTDCGQSALAATLENTEELAASFIWDFGRSPDGGLYYNSQYLSDSLLEPTNNVIHNKNSEYNDGSVGGNNIQVSGNTVTRVTGNGENGNFTQRFAPCNGTSQININGTNYTVSSCSGSNSMTLATSPPSGYYYYTQWYNPATIHVTSGSASVAGTGTGFTGMFACNGTDYITILGATGSDNGSYLVSSCADATHLTLSTPWAGATQTAQNDFAWSHAASSSCAPSIGTCEADLYSGKNLAHDWPFSLGQAYQWTQNTTWYSRLEYGLGSVYGGPATGPAFVGPQSGPQSALGPANFDGVMPSCFTTKSVQPCTNDGNGDGLLYGLGAKPFGESVGAGNARNAIADYLLPAGARRPTIRNEIVKSVVYK